MGGRGAKSTVTTTQQGKKRNFNDYRFGGLGASRISNKYLTMNRVSEDGNRIVVKTADSNLIETRYGYGLILDNTHVVWLKDWQVSSNYYGTEVVLTKQYFKPKEWGQHAGFSEDPKNLKFSEWKKVAKAQQKRKNKVMWKDEKIKFFNPKSYLKI